jgi:hypothetical protein
VAQEHLGDDHGGSVWERVHPLRQQALGAIKIGRLLGV